MCLFKLSSKKTYSSTAKNQSQGHNRLSLSTFLASKIFFKIIFNVFCEALYYYIALNVQYVLVQCVFDEHSFVINVTHWT